MATSKAADNSIAFINGRVYTINDAQPWAEAFIVDSNGCFSMIGSSADITAQAKKDHIITHDLDGEFIMPGIHDAHVHLLMSSMAATSQIRLPGQGLTMSSLADELKKGKCLCKYGHANQDWLYAHTYMVEEFDRKALDADFPDTPVVVRGGAGHSVFANSEALRRSGYDLETEKDAQGAHFIRDPETGHLTGEMAENALSKLMIALPQPPIAHAKRVLREGQKMLHRAGVTSCQEASANTLMLTALRELEADGDLKLDVQTHIVYAPDWIGEEPSETLHKLLDEADEFKSIHVDTRFVKIILDGVPLEPYYTQAGLKEDGKVDESKLFILNVREAIQKYDERGMTMKIHCTGHGSTRLTLDAFETTRKANPNGPRHEIAHCSGVHPDEYARFKPLNITAEMSPAFFFRHPVTKASGGLMDWDFDRMRGADAHVTIGSDWGAGAEPDILPHMANVVDTIGEGDRAKGGERICRMLTLAGAEAVGREKLAGSIEVGKKANFIAVSKDLSKGEFEGVSVLKTWFEGEVVYEKP
ncbi:hypothetical protein LTR56_017390 [Elasticomyces elasticus]|nr:hypothetical protein LTR56_017390 [Elasticomyces elasticus]KAK3639074.1 hypothetical protein LTR22_017602 [Elasticomyces elasticus]KAK4915627.1 hypothetical protein LTR49_016229 [Elasticomyces elasticus]KAK5752613.1 hypothetical protein LTS12_017276 [Elasticomyces elasticus]